MADTRVTYFAETDTRNKHIKFGIKADDRSRHMYVIGKTGMGKSTMLENLAIQDIQNGEGLAFIDPHGKTADLLLEYIPEHRIKDVLYFAPFDLEHPISFNVMEDVGHDKRHLVANGLMSAFKKIWVDAWSARMEYILNNILLALLEFPGATLIGVNRMLSDKDYRNKVVANISDPSVKSFWIDEFAKYGEKYMQEAGAAIQNKIGQFVSNPIVRNIIGQPKSTFDIRTMMDDKKIIIINLSKGRVGEANANLIGSMLITKIYLGAMSRADLSDSMIKRLPPFYLYVDEFQNFANESFADILSEARKYKLALTVAHQYIEQMSDEVRAAVFGNVGSMIVFRVGAFDAEVLEKEFAPVFTQEDIVNLGFVQVYMKLMIDGVTSQPFSAKTLPPIEKPLISYREDIMKHSRETFARPRAEVEEEIRAWHLPVNAGPAKPRIDQPKFQENRNFVQSAGNQKSYEQKVGPQEYTKNNINQNQASFNARNLNPGSFNARNLNPGSFNAGEKSSQTIQVPQQARPVSTQPDFSRTEKENNSREKKFVDPVREQGVREFEREAQKNNADLKSELQKILQQQQPQKNPEQKTQNQNQNLEEKKVQSQNQEVKKEPHTETVAETIMAPFSPYQFDGAQHALREAQERELQKAVLEREEKKRREQERLEQNKKDKGPKPENVASLKQALAAVMQNQNTNNIPKEKQKQSVQQETASSQEIKEVPESVLKRALGLDV